MKERTKLFEKLASLEYHKSEDGKRCDLPFEAVAFEIEPVSSTWNKGKYQINTWAGNFFVTRCPAVVSDNTGSKYYDFIECTEGGTTQSDIECLLAYLSQKGFI